MFTAVIAAAAFAQLPPLTPKTVDEFLPALQAQESDYLERLEIVAKAFLGVPYDEDPLGEGPNAPYDNDPLIDLLHVDTITYVEQCFALAAASSLEDATAKLSSIRYIAGEVDYARRNHYLVADWVINNSFVSNITRNLGVPTTGHMRFIDRKEKFKDTKAAPLFENVNTEGITVHYILTDAIPKITAQIPDNSLIVFITARREKFGDHCGLFFRDSDDDPEGRFYRASPRLGRVVVGTVAEAALDKEGIAAILVYKIHPERMAFLEQPEPEEAAPETE